MNSEPTMTSSLPSRAAALIAVAGCLTLACIGPLAAQDQLPPTSPSPAAQGEKKPELTPEQRQQALAFFEENKGLTPEQRQKALQEQSFFKGLSQGQQERMLKKAGQQRKEQGTPGGKEGPIASGGMGGPGGGMGIPPEMRAKLEKMSPEERAQFMQQAQKRHQEMRDRFEKLSPEEKNQVKSFREIVRAHV